LAGLNCAKKEEKSIKKYAFIGKKNLNIEKYPKIPKKSVVQPILIRNMSTS
jgi:hypothetical protein